MLWLSGRTSPPPNHVASSQLDRQVEVGRPALDVGPPLGRLLVVEHGDHRGDVAGGEAVEVVGPVGVRGPRRRDDAVLLRRLGAAVGADRVDGPVEDLHVALLDLGELEVELVEPPRLGEGVAATGTVLGTPESSTGRSPPGARAMAAITTAMISTTAT